MARTYKRDSRGRFASGGGSGGSRASRPSGPASPARGRKQGTKPTRRQGLVTQRRAVASTKRKLAAMDPADQSIKGALSKRAQKAAVTRARNKLKAAKEAGTVKLPKMKGAVRVGRKKGKGVNAGAKPQNVTKMLDTPRIKIRGKKPAGSITPPILASRIRQLGGKRWQKNGNDRYYFNNISVLGGIKTDRYKTGNISSATLRGRHLSNSAAGEMMDYINRSKVYYDAKKKKVELLTPGAFGNKQRDADRLVRSVAAGITRKARMQARGSKGHISAIRRRNRRKAS